MTDPISIVITSYNRESFLGGAIQSVLAQNRRDFRLLVWDDGSTDGSVELARKFAVRDSRMTVIAAEHRGQSSSLREALARAGGDYIGWVDDDDLLAPEALGETAGVLDAQPSVGMVYTDYDLIDLTGKPLGSGKRCKIPYSRNRILLDFMTFHFRMIRRTWYEKVGGVDEFCSFVQDYDLCLKLSEVADIHHVNLPLYHYRIHPDNMTRLRQIEMIEATHKVITAALQRRGMADRFDLDVRITPKFILRRKAAIS